MMRDQVAPRIFFDEAVLLELEGGAQLAGRAHNLSASGIFVRCERSLDPGTAARLVFNLPGGERIAAAATVVRQCPRDGFEPAGVALCFDEIDAPGAKALSSFISDRLQPAAGDAVRISIAGVPFPVAAVAQNSWGNVVAVDAPLPFLRVGSSVHLEPTAVGQLPQCGAIRWVSVFVDPDDGVPRLNIGLEVEEIEPTDDFDELDPVCTEEFAQHVCACDEQIRAARRSDRSAEA